jgi:GNAT superfamily N-acetyltransferase
VTALIQRLDIPAATSDPSWADFAAALDIQNDREAAAYGTDDVRLPPSDVLPHWNDPHEPCLIWVARAGRDVVGWAGYRTTVDDPLSAWVDTYVAPAAQRSGLGTRLADLVEEHAATQGLTKLLAYAVSEDAPGERLAAPTGFGSVPAGNREVRFLRARGFRLEQVERGSRFPLPADADALARLRTEAERHAEGYAVHTWSGITPERWLDEMAVLHVRMSTDAPSAGLEEPEETWDADRVRERETRILESPSDFLTTAIEHLPTGRLAGYTRFLVPDSGGPVNQWTTIVRREDRGHRLGMLLKIANLQELDARFPGHPSVVTWNAEENRHMLDVNEAIGFLPIGYEGAWRKDLDGASDG